MNRLVAPKKLKDPLKGFKFFIDSSLDTEKIKAKIEQWGGKTCKTVTKNVAAIISTKGFTIFHFPSFFTIKT